MAAFAIFALAYAFNLGIPTEKWELRVDGWKWSGEYRWYHVDPELLDGSCEVYSVYSEGQAKWVMSNVLGESLWTHEVNRHCEGWTHGH
jgi:hypothetical protein